MVLLPGGGGGGPPQKFWEGGSREGFKTNTLLSKKKTKN